MEDSISKLLQGLKQPVRRFRSLTIRITEAEFMELQSHAQTRYLNYSDVMREALAAFLRTDNPA